MKLNLKNLLRISGIGLASLFILRAEFNRGYIIGRSQVVGITQERENNLLLCYRDLMSIDFDSSDLVEKPGATETINFCLETYNNLLNFTYSCEELGGMYALNVDTLIEIDSTTRDIISPLCEERDLDEIVRPESITW